VIGAAYNPMSLDEGRLFCDPTLPSQTPDARRKIFTSKIETLANLHVFDPEKIGLGDFGKPGNYFARQVDRWTKQYRASETQHIPEFEKLAEWLPKTVPAQARASIVHGDYRLDNMVIHASEPRVIAVLDWELSTIGHPLGDFTYHLMPWQMPLIGIGSAGLLGKDLEALGIPSADAYAARYCERTGRREIRHRDFYAAYNFFRIAAILQGIAGRVRDGTAASAHAANAAMAVAPLAKMGWEYAERAGA
jgi:aminoglycoside phosphotransferase (APT) family kinase protein